MSYCRWSSNNWDCDVYVYEDVAGGWTIHVAGRRRKPITGPCPAMDFSGPDALAESYKKQREWLDGEGTDYEWEDLPEKWACESYNVPTPGEAANLLQQMLDDGLHVPVEVINELREEDNESTMDTDVPRND